MVNAWEMQIGVDTMRSIQAAAKKIPGVELRDMFAMNAMSMFHNSTYFSNNDYDSIAEKCYAFADAMLKARKPS